MLNETTSVVSQVWQTSITYLQKDFLTRVWEIIQSPFQEREMLWMLIPLLATIIFMEFYFGRYKEEELGWNTAYGNTLILLFIGIDLFRRTYEPLGLTIRDAITSGEPKIVIAITLFGFALLLLLIDFFHFLPKKIAYIVSSPTYINLLALLGVIVVYSKDIPLDWTTLAACIVMFGIFMFIAQIIYWIVPGYHPPLKRILTMDDLASLRKEKRVK
ncbi:MAG: hypothetical protein WC916_01900 [Candidatus Woesearchaeota archaeon]